MWTIFLFSLWICLLNSLNADEKEKYSVVVMQLMPNIITPHRELSIVNTYNFAKANGYEYHLIETKLSEYILEDWHESWFVADSIRQILSNKTIDALIYIDTLSLYNDVEKPIELRLEELGSEHEIFFSSASKSQCQSTNKQDCILQFPNVQIWKNSPFVQIILDDWNNCPSKLLDCFMYASKTAPYAYAAFEGTIRPAIPTNTVGYLPCQVQEQHILHSHRIDSSPEITNHTHYCALFFNEQSLPALPSTGNPLASYTTVLTTFTHSLLLHDILEQHRHTLTFREGFCELDCFREVFRKVHPLTKTFVEVETLVDAYDDTLDRLRGDGCNNQMDLETCHGFVDYILSKQMIRQKNITRCRGEQIKAKLLTRLHSLQLTHTPQDLHNFQRLTRSQPSRTIVTIFAGRYDRLSLVMKYWQLALQAHLVQEIHLWDFCRNETDRKLLNRFAMEDKRVKLMHRSTNRRHWVDYYEYYDLHSQAHPQDILIKCDDDIVFIDLHMLPYFIDTVRSQKKTHKYLSQEEGEQQGGIVFANILNNGVASYYQQKELGLLPAPDALDPSGIFHGEEFDYPEGGLEGSLWSNATKAELLHQYFLSQWETLLPSPHTPFEATTDATTSTSTTPRSTFPMKYQPEFIPIQTRFSINFFGIHASQWHLIRDIGDDDEFHLTVTLPEGGYLQNFLCANFLVSHLSFNSQAKNMNTVKVLEEYRKLFEDFSIPLRTALNLTSHEPNRTPVIVTK